MRTTFNPSPNVQRVIRERARLTGRSISDVVNGLLEQAIATDSTPHESFKVRARPLDLRPGIDPEKLGALLDELEVSGE